MAQFNSDFVGKFQTTLDADIEETEFIAGDEVRIMATWEHHFLIKDDEGHYYNVPREVIQE